METELSEVIVKVTEENKDLFQLTQTESWYVRSRAVNGVKETVFIKPEHFQVGEVPALLQRKVIEVVAW